jgi:hypothetical protein
VVAAVRAYVADADADLTEADRAVLAHAADVSERNGTDRPALPRRRIVEATGLGDRAVRNALARLGRRGLLVCAVRGRPAGQATRPENRRASCYRLPPPRDPSYLYRGTRSVGPPAQVCGTPRIRLPGPPPRSVGPPPAPNPPNPTPTSRRPPWSP